MAGCALTAVMVSVWDVKEEKVATRSADPACKGRTRLARESRPRLARKLTVSGESDEYWLKPEMSWRVSSESWPTAQTVAC